MGETRGFIHRIAISLVLLSFLVPWAHLHAAGEEQVSAITEWQMLWEQPGEEMTIEQVSALGDQDGWFPVKAEGEYPVLPEGIKSAWLKFQLPELSLNRPALNISKLYAKDMLIYIEDSITMERHRNYSYDINEVIVPLSNVESFKTIYVKLVVNIERLGLQNPIEIGEYDDLYRNYIKFDLIDVVLGTGLIFIAFFMMVSMLFLSRRFLPGWNSLFLVMLTIGVMIFTYSSFVDKFFPEYGKVVYILFDVASSLLIPALFSFFEKIFGSGPYGLITKYKTIQKYFIVFYLCLLIASLYSDTISQIYYSVGFIGFTVSILIGNIILLVSLAYQFKSKNKEAMILSTGISIFAGVVLLELLWYFYNNKLYKMFYWKISILFFLASLIIILVRRVMHNYEQAIQYSKQIEIFNNELQRSEKIELISNLAASIAHEVRNPLQVTRGFLQLLGQKSNDRDRSYMTLAIDELDRASEIITDFLTFAKPDLGEVKQIDVSEELQQIAAIIAPLATMSGGSVKLDCDEALLIRGNSSRFKQALINIIKNSIEALGENGKVEINAYKNENNDVVIEVKDNGEGIDPEDLKRLGEPYYSKKTKGTGLGLMVTYRIIEAMNGNLKFESTKGIGTEAYITIRSA
ncbi:ATP-binding protein [Paenibacillus pinisoli]|nr:ATP-binding protein [Paenibacillus pinisoli]